MSLKSNDYAICATCRTVDRSRSATENQARILLIERYKVIFFPVRSNQAELLDEADLPNEALLENFRDISRINRYFGGQGVVLRLLEKVVATGRAESLGRHSPIRLLDIATGAADIPLAVSRWAIGRGLLIEITATDYSEDVLKIARSTVEGIDNIRLERADARSLSYEDGSFDIATCSLALHHFSDEEAVEILREMRRVARVAIIVNDLRRCMSGYLAARAYGLLFTRNRLTRNDAPLSVLRSFTVAELAELVRRADIGPAIVERQPGWRLSLLSVRQPLGGS